MRSVHDGWVPPSDQMLVQAVQLLHVALVQNEVKHASVAADPIRVGALRQGHVAATLGVHSMWDYSEYGADFICSSTQKLCVCIGV